MTRVLVALLLGALVGGTLAWFSRPTEHILQLCPVKIAKHRGIWLV